jgi:hypothetical protein
MGIVAIIVFILVGATFFGSIQAIENVVRKVLTKRRWDKVDALLARRKKSDYQK